MTKDRYSDGSYLARFPTWHAERSAWKASQVLDAIKAQGLAPETVCDIGCGVGLILRDVVDGLPSVTQGVGFDISPDVPGFPEHPRIEYLTEDATESGRRFDLALMCDVFEHVEDNFSFMRRCAPLARHFVFHIPLDANLVTLLRSGLLGPWHHNGHLHCYTDATAQAFLEETGFEIVATHFTRSGWRGANRNPRSFRNLLRRAVFAVSPRLTHRVLGGVSLLVIARSRTFNSPAET